MRVGDPVKFIYSSRHPFLKRGLIGELVKETKGGIDNTPFYLCRFVNSVTGVDDAYLLRAEEFTIEGEEEND